MKRAIFGLLAVNLVLLGLLTVALGQGGQKLLTISEPAKPMKLPESAKKASSDVDAVKAWWRELNGDDALRVLEMTPRKSPKDFEIKLDVGGPLGATWRNCAEYLDSFKGIDDGPDSLTHKLRNGSTGAQAFTMKLKSADSRQPFSSLFVVSNGEVIYTTRSFRQAR